jgi:hypothetical protein
MTRLLILVGLLLLVVYLLRSIFRVSPTSRRRAMPRQPEHGGRVIEGETPRVRDPQDSAREPGRR